MALNLISRRTCQDDLVLGHRTHHQEARKVGPPSACGGVDRAASERSVVGSRRRWLTMTGRWSRGRYGRPRALSSHGQGHRFLRRRSAGWPDEDELVVIAGRLPLQYTRGAGRGLHDPVLFRACGSFGMRGASNGVRRSWSCRYVVVQRSELSSPLVGAGLPSGARQNVWKRPGQDKSACERELPVWLVFRGFKE